MSPVRVPILLAAALGCGLLALSAPSDFARADPPPQAIRSDARQLALDVHREARVLAHQVRRDAHQLHHQLLVTRDRMSGQLHQLGHRIERWWGRVRAG